MAVVDFAIDQEAAENAALGKGPYTLIPEGIYHLRCDTLEQKPAQAADKSPQLECTFVIVASENGQRVGDKTKIWFSLSPKAIPYFLQKYLDAIGVQYDFVDRPTPGGTTRAISFDPDHILGSVVKGKLKHGINKGGKNQGKPREDWESFEPSEFDPVNGASVTAAAAAPAQAQAARQTVAAAPAAAAPAASMAGQGAAPMRSVRGPRG